MHLKKWSDYHLKARTLCVIVSVGIMITGSWLLSGCRAGERLEPLHHHHEEAEEQAPQATPEQQAAAKAQAKEKAQQLREEIKQGADLGKLAPENSECPRAKDGGDLGFFGPGQMAKEFEQAAFDLEVGQVSDIVETEFGFHIIKVEDRRTNESGDVEVRARHILISPESFLPAAEEPGKAEQAEEPPFPQPEKKEPPKLADVIADARSDTKKTALQAIRRLGGFINTGTAEQKDKAMRELLASTRRKDSEIVVAAIAAFARHSTAPVAAERMSQLLSHPNPQIAGTATDALIKMYAKTNDAAALTSLLGIEKADASAKAAIQLNIMGRKVVPKLIEVLRTSPKPAQRHAAGMVLAMVCAGSSPQQDKFAELALATRHAEMKQKDKASPADLRVLPAFADAVVNDDSAKVREICAQGLGYLGNARAAPALAQALRDPVESVRRRAAAALITVPAKEAQPALENTVRTDSSPAVRRYAAEALGWIGDQSVVPTLTHAAADSDPEVRRYAATQLGRMGDPQALQALAALFDDPNEDVRWAAVVAVGKLQDRQAREALVEALYDPSPMVSHAAERGLQKLGIARRKADEFEK